MSDPQSVGVSGFARAKCEMSGFAECEMPHAKFRTQEVKGVNPRLQFWVPNPRLKGGAKVEGHAVLHWAGGRAGPP